MNEVPQELKDMAMKDKMKAESRNEAKLRGNAKNIAKLATDVIKAKKKARAAVIIGFMVIIIGSAGFYLIVVNSNVWMALGVFLLGWSNNIIKNN